MPREMFLALAVAFKDALVAFRRALFHPGKQGRAEVEAYPGIIIDDLRDAAFGIKYSRGAVGKIALASNAFVPVMVRTRGILRFDRFQPRIFPRWLIKMTMNAGETLHSWHSDNCL